MTRIRKPVVTNTITITRRVMLAAILGMVAGIAATVSAMQYVPDAIAANENAMFNGCKLPDIEGAVTLFIMIDGRIQCWRHK